MACVALVMSSSLELKCPLRHAGFGWWQITGIEECTLWGNRGSQDCVNSGNFAGLQEHVLGKKVGLLFGGLDLINKRSWREKYMFEVSLEKWEILAKLRKPLLNMWSTVTFPFL